MSLTSYRAAPPRVRCPEGLECDRGVVIVWSEIVSFQVWRRPTLPRLETQYHWRRHTYRPSSGWDREFCACYDHQTGEETGEARLASFAPRTSVLFHVVCAFDDPGMAFALLFPDQIKPIGQLVPVS